MLKLHFCLKKEKKLNTFYLAQDVQSKSVGFPDNHKKH